MAAVWINKNNPNNIIFEVLKEWEIDQIEATAVEAALSMAPIGSNLIIITDSLVTLNNIKYWQTNKTKDKNKCNSVDVIHRIYELFKERDLEVEFLHVNSHLMDEDSVKPNKVVEKQMEAANKQFGDFANMAIIGNKEVDKLTKD